MVTGMGGQLTEGLLVATVAVVPLCSMGVSAEVCHYTGPTDYDGHVAVGPT
jgi:hypothetical protein